MSFGLQLISGSIGRVIDQDVTVPYAVDTGYRPLTKSGTYILPLERTLVSTVAAFPPLILIRPDTADRYVGGFFGGNASVGQPAAQFSVTGQCGFHWAVFAGVGTPIQDSTQYGLEVYRSDGSVAYSSRRIHPRLRQIVQVNAASLTAGEIYVPLSGFSSRPWLVANDLLATFSGVGDGSEFVPALMARVNSSNTGIYLGWRDYADNSAPGPYGALGYRKLDGSNSNFGTYNTFFYGSNFFVSLYEIPDL